MYCTCRLSSHKFFKLNSDIHHYAKLSLLVSRKENLSQTHLLVSYIPYSLAQKGMKLTGLDYVHIHVHVPDIYMYMHT